MPISEGNLLEIKIEMEELITTREGMIATNLQRESLGHSMAYDEEAFETIVFSLKSLREQLIQLQRG